MSSITQEPNGMNTGHGPMTRTTRTRPGPGKEPWMKLLWLRQDYPDNYTDSSFLSQLKRNSTVINYSYITLVNDFTLILLHFSTILLVLIVFYGVYNLHWNPVVPTAISSVLTLLGYLVFYSGITTKQTETATTTTAPVKEGMGNNTDASHAQDTLTVTSKSTLLILLILFILSPVLKSLTNSTSSDSIWALSCWLCILNFIFNDYSVVNAHDSGSTTTTTTTTRINFETSSNNLSKNLSLSNAIVLASRLNSNVSVFSFVLFSIQINGLFPIFNNFIRHTYGLQSHYLQLSIIVTLVDFLLYYELGINYLIVVFIFQILIVIIGPWYFIELQKYKDELQGPWDPAKPVLTSI